MFSSRAYSRVPLPRAISPLASISASPFPFSAPHAFPVSRRLINQSSTPSFSFLSFCFSCSPLFHVFSSHLIRFPFFPFYLCQLPPPPRLRHNPSRQREQRRLRRQRCGCDAVCSASRYSGSSLFSTAFVKLVAVLEVAEKAVLFSSAMYLPIFS